MKNKLTKILALMLICTLCAPALVSCAGGAGGNVADVHVFYYTYSDPYISSVRTALDAKLSDAGISFQDYDGNNNQTTQTEQIQTAITKGAKAIIVNIVNTSSDDAANGIVSLAQSAGVPVIFFNREVSDDVITSYENCAYVGTNAMEAGVLQGEMIGEYVLEHYDEIDLNGDGNISYIMFKGEEGNMEAVYRTEYGVSEADAVLTEAGRNPLTFYDERNPNRYLVDKNGQWSAVAANEYMTTALTSYGEERGNMIELVICNNDNMAEGAISALNSAGYNLGGTGKRIPVFGVDATDAAKDLIANGKMTGTIKQDADGMAQAILHLCRNSLSGTADLMDETHMYNVDDTVNKVRIAYAKYLGSDTEA